MDRDVLFKFLFFFIFNYVFSEKEKKCRKPINYGIHRTVTLGKTAHSSELLFLYSGKGREY